MYQTSKILLVLVVFLVLLPTHTLGQTVTGEIHGQVTDETEAAIPGATVTALNQETGLRRTTITNDVGFYTLPSLPPGLYTVSAEIAGFKRFEQTDVELTVGQRVRVDNELQVGEISESVTVRGGTVMVDTRSAELSSLVDDKRITDLPLNGRNVMALSALLTGVSTVRAPQAQTGSRSGPRLTVHGGRANSNYLTLNGAYFNNPSRNTGMNPPPPDAVREFRIKTNNFSAAEGRNSGAVVSIVTRSGTNDFHGSVWEFHRNHVLNSREFFQAERRTRIQNQFGAAAGGPIVRDKVHIFASYEGLRDRPAPSPTGAEPPTAAERAGDFSNVSKQLVDPFTDEPFTGNQVPTSLFDPVSMNLLQSLPLPNQPDGSFQQSRAQPTNTDLVVIRNDINISENHSLFWHYYYNEAERPSRIRGNIPGWQDFSSTAKFHNFGITHNYVISPTLMNSFTFGFSPASQDDENIQRRTTEELGMDYPNYTPYGSPQFRVSGRFDLRSISQLEFDQDAMNFHESMSYTRGDHTFKYGLEFFRLEFLQAFLSPPSFRFNGSRSGDAVLDFLMGAWRSNTLGYGRRLNDTIQPWYWSFYFQDEWRVNPRLTLTLGLRYELPSPWNDHRELALSSIVLPLDACREDLTVVGPTIDLVGCGAQTTAAPVDAPPGYLFANFDLPRGLAEADTNNFAPRLGFAYDVTGNGQTSIRGGLGIFYDTSNADTLAQTNPPFANTVNFSNGRLGAPNVGLTGPLPPVKPTAQEGGFTTPLNPLNTDLSLSNTYFYHWNLGVQRQVTRDLLVSIDYVGKIGRKGLAFYPWNPGVFIPGVSTLENADDRVLYGRGVYGAYYNLMLGSMFDTWYHGMDVEVNKRLSNGFSLLSSFTWSKAIDQNSTFNLGGDSPDPFHLKESEQGLARFDRRVVLSVSALWEPFATRTFDGAAKYFLEGWNFAPIFRTTTGAPLEFFNGDDIALDGVGFGQHPVALRNPDKSHSSNLSKVSEWFDTTALVLPEEGTYGNAAKGLVAGPGFVNFDLAILKDFPLGVSEDSRVQFRAEFFNLFNNTNFNNPTTTVLSSRFGRIRSSGDARQIQFGLKVLW
ncbi:TonB-dependent receptor [Acidobacteria bacterium AH-259-O06]|nr:TonB-dependent receptor [Acidobacteria bacterium AH-259-O06]